jgi:uncharacterized protein (TIGR02001 family)
MKLFHAAVLIIAALLTNTLMAQDTEDEKSSKFSPGVDFYSSYIWRGSKLGTGPAVQPYLEFATGGLTIGAWGSFDASGFSETDLYATYSLPFGLSVGLTDYYYPDLDYFDYSDSTGSHAFELTAGYEIKGLSLSANVILNQAGGIESEGGDIYLEAAYAFKYFSIFLGAGNGWTTSDGDFAVCNIGIKAEKEIKITDSFSIPLNGQVVLNPDKKSLYVVVGFSL